MSYRRCGRPTPGQSSYNGCEYPRMKGLRRCEWHWLISQPSHVQEARATGRMVVAETSAGYAYRARVPASEWPEGERWCAGCQSFVPLFYCSGSRCKACSSKASHESRVQATYGLAPGEYDELFKLQGGRCFICQRESKGKRFAVDHDHKTGRVRGLLCANNEHGCNAGVVGNLEAAHDGGLAAARRAVLYFTLTPYERLKSGDRLTWDQFVAQEWQSVAVEAAREAVRADGKVPPF